MKVSIVGAGGEVGRMLAIHLLRAGLLRRGDVLQLVGHGEVSTARKLLAMRVDLLDGFDEVQPEIEVVSSLDAIEGDIIVMTAGSTISPDYPTRRDLAAANKPLFEDFATAVATHGCGREIIVVVSNPVELAVDVVARRIDRHRVLGMGAQQDSLRFARALADDLGVHRTRVHAWVLGEHGDGMVPIWSGVQLLGADPKESSKRVLKLRDGTQLKHFDARIQAARSAVMTLMNEGDIEASYQAVHQLSPDLRILIEPFITHHCLNATANATANATCDLVQALTTGRDSIVAAQVKLARETHGLNTVCGMPVIVNAGGWSNVACPDLAEEEKIRLLQSCENIASNLKLWNR
ncbi:MAG: hypothetical protein P8L39_11075 [Halioglobus sp.]|nr:hypothetical protein [Halioglobus sp.]